MMFVRNTRTQAGIGRRMFLGSAAAVVGLPLLDSLAPRRARAAAAPCRLLFYFVPSGMNMRSFTPVGSGATYTMSPILKPLEPYRADFSVLNGISNPAGQAMGGGDHASGTAAFLTGFRAKKTQGADFSNEISADQIAAKALGARTRLASLQLGTEEASRVGGGDTGYGPVYMQHISWAGPTSPLVAIVNPQTVFDRLFDGFDPAMSNADRDRRQRQRKSVIDSVIADVQGLRPRVGRTDQRKLDEYLTGVRELEKRIGTAPGAAPSVGAATGGCAPGTRPRAFSASPMEFPELMKTMNDLMVLAFQCDTTRFISFMYGLGRSERSYPGLGQHHSLSHTNSAPGDSLEKIGIIEMQHFAYLLDRLNKVQDTDGSSLLANTALFLSSELSEGAAHNHGPMPILLAGAGAGAFKPGRSITLPNQRQSNVLATMLQAVGLPAKIGDSTGPIAEL